ncbi:MAG: hypothetical protein ABJP48_03695 [Erythrobacter sp.]
MIFGILIPIILLVIAVIEIPLILALRKKGSMPANFGKVAIVFSILLPVFAYVLLNFVMPDLGNQVVS